MKKRMTNTVDPDQTARDEPSDLDLHCLHEPSDLDLHCLHRYLFQSAGLKDLKCL